MEMKNKKAILVWSDGIETNYTEYTSTPDNTAVEQAQDQMHKEVQTIKISSKEMKLINDLLNLTGDEIYQKYRYKRDETITHTTKFSNGVEADIKLVICEDEHPYTEGVLFHNGFELTCTEPGCTYDGEWNFECNGIEYTVFVEVEN